MLASLTATMWLPNIRIIIVVYKGDQIADDR